MECSSALALSTVAVRHCRNERRPTITRTYIREHKSVVDVYVCSLDAL